MQEVKLTPSTQPEPRKFKVARPGYDNHNFRKFRIQEELVQYPDHLPANRTLFSFLLVYNPYSIKQYHEFFDSIFEQGNDQPLDVLMGIEQFDENCFLEVPGFHKVYLDQYIKKIGDRFHQYIRSKMSKLSVKNLKKFIPDIAEVLKQIDTEYYLADKYPKGRSAPLIDLRYTIQGPFGPWFPEIQQTGKAQLNPIVIPFNIELIKLVERGFLPVVYLEKFFTAAKGSMEGIAYIRFRDQDGYRYATIMPFGSPSQNEPGTKAWKPYMKAKNKKNPGIYLDYSVDVAYNKGGTVLDDVDVDTIEYFNNAGGREVVIGKETYPFRPYFTDLRPDTFHYIYLTRIPTFILGYILAAKIDIATLTPVPIVESCTMVHDMYYSVPYPILVTTAD